jgi:hypothetical protein
MSTDQSVKQSEIDLNLIKDITEHLRAQAQNWFPEDSQTPFSLNRFFVTKFSLLINQLSSCKNEIDKGDYFGFTRLLLQHFEKAGHIRDVYPLLNYLLGRSSELKQLLYINSNKLMQLKPDDQSLISKDFQITEIYTPTGDEGIRLNNSRTVKLSTKFKNADRRNYFCIPIEMEIAISFYNGFSIRLLSVKPRNVADVNGDSQSTNIYSNIIFPYAYISEYEFAKINNSALDSWISNGIFTVTDLICEFLRIISDVSILNGMLENQINVERTVGPRCSFSGAWTFNDAVYCEVRNCALCKDVAIQIDGLYFHPDIIKECSECGVKSHNWINTGDKKFKCGGCVNVDR